MKTGDIIYYKGAFFTILGQNTSDVSMVNGVTRANAFYFNYTENYEENSAFKLDSIKNLSSIVGNPNSYLSTVISSINGEMVELLDDPNFKIVDKTMLQSLYKKYDNRKEVRK